MFSLSPPSTSVKKSNQKNINNIQHEICCVNMIWYIEAREHEKQINSHPHTLHELEDGMKHIALFISILVFCGTDSIVPQNILGCCPHSDWMWKIYKNILWKTIVSSTEYYYGCEYCYAYELTSKALNQPMIKVSLWLHEWGCSIKSSKCPKCPLYLACSTLYLCCRERNNYTCTC